MKMGGKTQSRFPNQRIFFFFIVLIISIVFLNSCGGGGGGDSTPAETTQQAPEAQISASTAQGSVPLSVTFDGTASTDDGSIATYAWDFGDGETADTATITHTYADAGTYTAKLTVTDNDGLSDDATQEIVVEGSAPSDPATPEAEFSVSTNSGNTPLTVTFDASASTDSDGSIATYAWDFGDGETGEATTTTHTYVETGTYTAKLTVTDNDGLSDSNSQDIIVHNSATGTYTISGTVTAATYAVVDSDVNDPHTTPVANDSFNNAQSLTAPVILSGYVNVAGAGEAGNSSEAGDYDDYFRVTLTQGATITLSMAEDPDSADLNLYLYDANQTQVDASLTTGDAIDSLTVPADNTYYIRVEAASDNNMLTASGYALRIGQARAAAARYPLRLSDDFVPGEVIVCFEDQATTATIASLAGDSDGVSAMGLSAAANASGRQRLLKRSTAVDKNTLFSNLGVRAAVNRSTAVGSMDAATRAKMETLWMVRAMAKQSGVKFAEPNYIRQALAVPDDPHYSHQWHYPLINLPDAWDITTGSSDVVVAVIDTGVLLDHPDLSGQLLDGYDFISDTDISLDGDGIDNNPDDPGDQDDVEGSSFHGTHVAGTIAAVSNNATGVSGIAWNTRILPLRVLGYGGGTNYDIIQAVRYAAGLTTDYEGVQRDTPVDVINLSLGGNTYSQSEAETYQEVRDQGVIVIAAAGNNGTSADVYPAAYDGVVSVSAVTINETLASYSSYGQTIDIAAPGGSSSDTNGDGYVDGVLSTVGDDSSGSIEMSYAFSTGTSMAAPHVTGVVALMKALYPELTPDEFDTLLQSGYLTRDLGDADWDEQFGWGLIDAYKAVQIAQEGGVNVVIPAILSVSPSTISLDRTQSSAEVTLENSGNAEAALTIEAHTADVSWLGATPVETDENGLGSYAITVDRNGLADGAYSGTLTFTSSANQVQVAVAMQVGSGDVATNGGYHYVLLLDAQTNEPVAQVDIDSDNGVYAYQFTGLAYGNHYLIYAGTNPDGDGYICEEGEACGSYLSLDQPATITIDADLENLDFMTDIHLNLSTTQSLSNSLALPLDLGAD